MANSTGLMGPCRYSLPSTPNDDPAYKDNSYWRGRVWGPLNLLVYMGLRHPKYANVPEIQAARKQLAIQSREAMMVEWLPKHHVHENLNPDTGLGDDVGNSNPMYLLRATWMYQPKDLNRDWSPRFSTLWGKNGWIRAKTA